MHLLKAVVWFHRSAFAFPPRVRHPTQLRRVSMTLPRLGQTKAAIIIVIAVAIDTGGVPIWGLSQLNSAYAMCPVNQDCTQPPPADPFDGVLFVAQSVPTMMSPGQQYTVAVTLKNTGSTSWSELTAYRLGSINPQDNWTWSVARVYLQPGELVAPGATKVFIFTVTAPYSPGTYDFQWRMVQEYVQWFGAATPNVRVRISGVHPDVADIVDADVPNWSKINSASCDADGIVWGGIDMSDAMINAIAQSPCFRLSRAVEGWASVPDAAKVELNIARIKSAMAAQGTSRRLVFGAFFAEAIDYTQQFYVTDSSTISNVTSWCRDAGVNWGPHVCVPDVLNSGYQAHLLILARKLILAGITDFQFGQLGYQDPGHLMGPFIAQLRSLGDSLGVRLLIGGQPNDLYRASYLIQFDYVVGPAHFDPYGDFLPVFDVEFDQKHSGSPYVFSPGFRAVGVHILTETDWASVDDDIHRVASLSPLRRADALYNIYDFMIKNGMGFTLPYGAIPLNAGVKPWLSTCVGMNQWVYEPLLRPPGAAVQAYTCQDAPIFDEIMNQRYAPASDSDQQLHWLQQVYRNVLLRQVDPGGQAYWLGLLNSGATRANVVAAILASGEAHDLFSSFIDGEFNERLQRLPSTAELGCWVGKLALGELTRSQVDESLIWSRSGACN
jgi:Domain of unknown function (DUF4214)/Ig-like domain from next to BRCA1 gene